MKKVKSNIMSTAANYQKHEPLIITQGIPLVLTFAVFSLAASFVYFVIRILNLLPTGQPIILKIHMVDILVGLTIYLKTSIDFAIFMGRLMHARPGWKNRIAIEVGTALGNALGTVVVIILWVIFKEIDILLALMVFIASLVLFELAHGSLEYIVSWKIQKDIRGIIYNSSDKFLNFIHRIISPLLSRILPNISGKIDESTGKTWGKLMIFAISVPFILGLDDFAGYVPLFSVINVFGFSVGVFAGHMILNIALFLSPEHTIKAVKNVYISFIGMIAFIAIAVYGFFEVFRIIYHSLV